MLKILKYSSRTPSPHYVQFNCFGKYDGRINHM